MEDITKFNDREFRRWVTQRLDLDEALKPNDERYVAHYAGDDNDPISLIFDDIDLSAVESLNFISGFRGSGKTTELFRLRQKLLAEGYFVAYANALDYVLPSVPVDISDFLLILAGAFSEAIEKEIQVDNAYEGFWTRFVNFLTRTKVELKGIDLKADVPGTDIGLNFKTSLKQVPSFRQELREKLSGRLGEVRREVHKFFEDARKTIHDARPDCGIVFIFDQFEQIRDTIDTEGRVAESVTTLIANNLDDLSLPFMHMVFTVPPWMKFKLSHLPKLRLLYAVKLWENDKERTPDNNGWHTLRRIVEKRFTEPGMERFFGKKSANGDYELADKLIHASGGHLKDLLRLLHESVVRGKTMPITDEIVKATITALRDSYLPISVADAKLLKAIGDHRDSNLPDTAITNVQRMTLFLDTHCALILRNGDEWYDVHPLIRDEVEEIMLRAPSENES